MRNKGITYIGQITRKSVRTGVTLQSKVVLPVPKDSAGNPVLGLKTNEDGSYRDHRYSQHEVTVKELEPDNYNKALEDLVLAIQTMQAENMFDDCTEDNFNPIYTGPKNGSIITYRLENEDLEVSKNLSQYLSQESGGKVKYSVRPKFGDGEVTG